MLKLKKDTVGINTYNNGKNTFSQTDNIRQNNNRGSQTHPIQLVEFGVNTNSSNPNFSTQTEPIDLSNQSTNTHCFNETTATQTRPLSFSTQPQTHTPPTLILDPTLLKQVDKTQQQQVHKQVLKLSLQKKRIVNVKNLNPTLQDNFMRVGETQRLGYKDK